MIPRLLMVVCATLSTLTAAPVDILPPASRDAIQPQVAIAPGGQVHVVFGKDTAIYHTASADRRTFSTPVKIAELDGLALGKRRGPRVSATEQTIVVTAISHTDGQLHAWTSADGGARWEEGRNINDAQKSAREGLHAMAGNGRGLVFATWLDLRNGGTELWSATSRDCGVNWGGNAPVYRSGFLITSNSGAPPAASATRAKK